MASDKANFITGEILDVNGIDLTKLRIKQKFTGGRKGDEV